MSLRFAAIRSLSSRNIDLAHRSSLAPSSILQNRPVHFQKAYSSIAPSKMDPAIQKLLDFYLNRNPWEWFMTPEGFDEQLRTNFGDLVNDARSSKLDAWRDHPKGSLALIILLDQIPRNIFRGSGESFSSDTTALTIASQSIAKGFDQEIGKENRVAQTLFYLPFEHAEDCVAQIAAVNLMKQIVLSCEDGSEAKEFCEKGIGFAQRHLDVVAKFGRFPGRNGPLGRDTTPEEEAFLKNNPQGF
jgi:uncharacterized protein (DUF924 family)